MLHCAPNVVAKSYYHFLQTALRDHQKQRAVWQLLPSEGPSYTDLCATKLQQDYPLIFPC